MVEVEDNLPAHILPAILPEKGQTLINGPAARPTDAQAPGILVPMPKQDIRILVKPLHVLGLVKARLPPVSPPSKHSVSLKNLPS